MNNETRIKQIKAIPGSECAFIYAEMPAQVCEYVISNIYWNLANVAQLYKDIDDENDGNEGGERRKQGQRWQSQPIYNH